MQVIQKLEVRACDAERGGHGVDIGVDRGRVDAVEKIIEDHWL